jgi:type II secretory pathway component PulM
MNIIQYNLQGLAREKEIPVRRGMVLILSTVLTGFINPLLSSLYQSPLPLFTNRTFTNRLSKRGNSRYEAIGIKRSASADFLG